MHRKPLQYSLGALIGILTAICLILGYLRFVGVWRFVLAIGPPLLIAAIANNIMSTDLARLSKEYREFEERFPAAVRVLSSLVLGLLIWIPVLLAIILMN